MSWFRRPNGLIMWPLWFALVWMAGCARPALHTNEAAAAPDSHPIPFHGEKGPNASDAPAGTGNPANSEAALPFHDSQNLPAGTLLTVRLRKPISSDGPGANKIFEAVIDEPVMVAGNDLVPRGTIVEGRVESTRASNVKRNRGYVRLALDSIHLGSADLPIQTSSLSVRGTPGDADWPQSDNSAGVIHVEKGRRLTFRLSESVYIAAGQRPRVEP